MNFQIFGNDKAPTLLLIPGLGVSYEIFLPLIRLVEERFRIIAVEVDGFTLGKHTRFTSVDDQASTHASPLWTTKLRKSLPMCKRIATDIWIAPMGSRLAAKSFRVSWSATY